MNKQKHLIFFSLFVIKTIVSWYFFSFSGMNPDEELNYRLASYFIDNGNYEPTAFYGSGTFFLYLGLIYFGIAKSTFLTAMFIIQNLCFLASLYWFYNAAAFVISRKKEQLVTTVVYGLYPSIIYFIGSLFYYENCTTYFLIYIVYFHLRIFNNRRIPIYDYILVPLLITVSVFVRGQLLPIYLFILFSLALLIIYHRLKNFRVTGLQPFVITVLLTIVLVSVAHYPILKKNREIFGASLISTQMGFELLQGHNPHARGSWTNTWRQPGNELYEYAHKEIPGLDLMNEYEASIARKKVAIDWIKSHPAKEIILATRKVALFFMPQNYKVLPHHNDYNPVNIIVQLLFLITIVLLVMKRKITSNIYILLLPVAGTIILSIVFFVGYRWKLYAEPFIVLIAMYGFFKWFLPGIQKLFRKKPGLQQR